MARKNRRFIEDLPLPLIKEEDEWRPHPRCPKFPYKTLFTSGFRAQMAIDDIRSRADDSHIPERVYECKLEENGCGFFHTTSMRDLPTES